MTANQMTTKIERIDKHIQTIKQKLLAIGEMRPGTLTRQYKVPAKKQGAYYQLSYTHKMKSRTDYIRPDAVKDTRIQITEYKKYKKLTEQWVELAIERAKLKRAVEKILQSP